MMFLFLGKVVINFIFKDLLYCRVCGNKITIHSKYKHPVNNESNKDVISDHFHINVINEKEAVFLKKCCECCKRQLHRYNKSSTEIVPHSDLVCFFPHCETDCHVCKKLR